MVTYANIMRHDMTIVERLIAHVESGLPTPDMPIGAWISSNEDLTLHRDPMCSALDRDKTRIVIPLDELATSETYAAPHWCSRCCTRVCTPSSTVSKLVLDWEHIASAISWMYHTIDTVYATAWEQYRALGHRIGDLCASVEDADSEVVDVLETHVARAIQAGRDAQAALDHEAVVDSLAHQIAATSAYERRSKDDSVDPGDEQQMVLRRALEHNWRSFWSLAHTYEPDEAADRANGATLAAAHNGVYNLDCDSRVLAEMLEAQKQEQLELYHEAFEDRSLCIMVRTFLTRNQYLQALHASPFGAIEGGDETLWEIVPRVIADGYVTENRCDAIDALCDVWVIEGDDPNVMAVAAAMCDGLSVDLQDIYDVAAVINTI